VNVTPPESEPTEPLPKPVPFLEDFENALGKTTTSTKADYQTSNTFGKLLDVGLAIFDPDWKLVNLNDQAIEFLDLDIKTVKSDLSYENVIKYMAQNGRLGQEDPELLENAMLQDMNFRRDQKITEAQVFNMTTPKGRNICIRQMINTDKSLTIAIEDTTEKTLQKETLEAALQSAASGYWHFNLKTQKFSLESLFFTEYLTPQEVQSLDLEGLYMLIHPGDRKSMREIWKHVAENGQTRVKTIRIKFQKSDALWLKFYLCPQFSEIGKITGIICFFTDVSRSLRIQDDLRKSKERAEKTLKSISDFHARMSHEIRTPMNAVIGITDALLQHHNDPAINPKLRLIEDSADSILRILDETLDHAKIHATQITVDPTLSKPGMVVENICQLWEIKAQKNNVTLNCKIDKNIPAKMYFDAYRFEQCLNNLISNAIKFSGGGKVDVVLTRIHKNGPPKLVLVVKDTGIGMSEEQQAHIFEAYTQADDTISRRFGGTGLGMNITQEIVSAMGGKINVNSKLGEGTLFVIMLPIEQEIREPSPTIKTSTDLVSQLIDEAKPEPTQYDNLRILIVDDNATNHLVVNSLLSSVVSEILTANNGREALDVLEVHEVDVVLMDIHMPVMDGIEATLAIRNSSQAWSNVPIIALTADPQYQQHRLCVNIGMDSALSKPVKLTSILTAFDKVLGQKDLDANELSHGLDDVESG